MVRETVMLMWQTVTGCEGAFPSFSGDRSLATDLKSAHFEMPAGRNTRPVRNIETPLFNALPVRGPPGREASPAKLTNRGRSWQTVTES